MEIRMREARGDDEHERGDCGEKEHEAQFLGDGDLAVHEDHRDDPHADGQRVVSERGRADDRKKVRRVACKADVTACDEQRREEHELPVEEKREHSPNAFAPEDLAQVHVGSARARIARAQFGPNEPVAHRDQGAGNPADKGKRSVEIREHESERNQRPDADHRDHVDGDGPAKIDAANHPPRSTYRPSRTIDDGLPARHRSAGEAGVAVDPEAARRNRCTARSLSAQRARPTMHRIGARAQRRRSIRLHSIPKPRASSAARTV